MAALTAVTPAHPAKPHQTGRSEALARRGSAPTRLTPSFLSPKPVQRRARINTSRNEKIRTKKKRLLVDESAAFVQPYAATI